MQGLLVVDVQPAYRQWADPVARKVAQRINNTRRPTTVMWVGEGFTRDTEYDVQAYLRDAGARPGKLAACRFVEKDYGFFRPMMDSGASPEIIVELGKAMRRQGVTSACDLDPEALSDAAAEQAFNGPGLNLPGWSMDFAKYFAGFVTCGGGADECLAEIELLLAVQDKNYQREDALTY